MQLPKHVHVVPSRGREYFYYQENRGTAYAGERIRLPNDPHAPEFWQALRQAQGVGGQAPADTVGAVIDAYLKSTAFTDLADTSKEQYLRALKLARAAWGELPIAGLRPVHIRTVMDGMAQKRATANIFLAVMRKISSWGRARDLILHSLTDGVEPYHTDGGHKPWTPAQIQCAHDELTGAIRKGVMLALYTGQRGSDIVRLGWTDVEENGFRLRQRKTGVEVWCPIVPELAAEMATWERCPGPFLLNKRGLPYSREKFAQHFAEARDHLPALQGASMHGLRATAVVRLRQAGISTAQIGDVIGMSIPMIERYCRFADKKASGKAALISLAERAKNTDCKTMKNRKAEA